MLLLQHSGTLVSSSSSCPSACAPSQSAGNRIRIEIASNSPDNEMALNPNPDPQGASLGLIRSSLLLLLLPRSPGSFLFLFFRPGSSRGSFCRFALAWRFSSNPRSTRAWQGIRQGFSNGFLQTQLSKHCSCVIANCTETFEQKETKSWCLVLVLFFLGNLACKERPRLLRSHELIHPELIVLISLETIHIHIFSFHHMVHLCLLFIHQKNYFFLQHAICLLSSICNNMFIHYNIYYLAVDELINVLYK